MNGILIPIMPKPHKPAMDRKPVKRPVGRPPVEDETDTASTRLLLPIKAIMDEIADSNRRTLSAEIAEAVDEHLISLVHDDRFKTRKPDLHAKLVRILEESKKIAKPAV